MIIKKKLKEDLATILRKKVLSNFKEFVLNEESIERLKDNKEAQSAVETLIFDDEKTMRIFAQSGSYKKYMGVKKIIFSEKITTIPYKCCEDGGCGRCETIVFKGAVTDIEYKAFMNLSNLKNIEGDLSKLQYISESAFLNTRITSFPFGSSLNFIGTGAFESCDDLTSIDLSNTSLTKIPEDCFYNCKALEDIKFPDTLKTIGKKAFYRCAMSEIDLKNVEVLENDAFNLCSSLQKVVFPKIVRIEDCAFWGDRNLNKVEFPETLTHLGDAAFCKCALTFVKLPDSLTSIGSAAFKGNKLTDIVVGKEITSLAPSSFAANDSEKVTVHTINPKLQEYCKERDIPYDDNIAFIPSMTEDLVKTIQKNKFATYKYNGGRLAVNPYTTSIVINQFPEAEYLHDFNLFKLPKLTEAVVKVNDEVLPINFFENCENLKKVELSPTITIIDNSAFRNCKSLEYIDLSNIVSIGDRAFEGCENLKEVKTGPNLSCIFDDAFNFCKSLKEFVFINDPLDDTVFIEHYAFRNIKDTCVIITNNPEIVELCQQYNLNYKMVN